MYNSIKTRTKKIICSLVLAVGVLLSAFSGYHIEVSQLKPVSASTTTTYLNDKFSNPLYDKGSSDANYYSFNSSSSSQFTTSVSGWSKTDSSSDMDSYIKSGIVNLENKSDWDTDKCKTSRPDFLSENHTADGYYRALMINSYDGSHSLGYKSNSISLESDSFYKISVSLYTEASSNASIYLTGLVDGDDNSVDKDGVKNLDKVKFENINTLGGLNTYTFYISTSEKKTINIELWLGSKTSVASGAVFFHEVEISRCTEAFYSANYSNPYQANDNKIDGAKYNFITLSQDKRTVVANGDFESVPFENWTTLSRGNTVGQIANAVNVKNYATENNIELPGSTCSSDNDQALLLYNKEEGYQGVESETFTVNQQSYYRLSFWAKSNCNTGKGATVNLVDKSENDPIENASLTLATTYTTDSNKYRNDWTNYNFYIYGPASETKELAIQICLGTKDSQTDGYVFVDDFTIEDISYNDYKTNSSNTNCTTFNMNDTNSSLTIANGQFNITENESNKVSYPLTPSDWTKSGDNYGTYSGIVNSKNWNINVENYYNPTHNNHKPTNPGKLPYMANDADNNFLMVGSDRETNSQSYSVSELTLNSGSYYKVTFYVATDYDRTPKGETDDYGASVKLATTDTVIFDYKNIHFTDSNWHKFEIYIDNSKESNNLTATLSLTFDDVCGYVFFDDVIITTSNENAYNNFGSFKDPDTTYLQVNLSGDNFDNRTYNTNYKDTLQTPANWTDREENEKVGEVNIAGIASTKYSLISGFPKAPSGNEHVLYISSSKDLYYSFVSSKTYTFSSNTYYRISVNILTNAINQYNEEDDIEYGASFKLSATDDIIFKSINTNGKWKNYTIFYCPDSDVTSAIHLSLGASEEYTAGDVLFDNLIVEKIEADTYMESIGNLEDSQFRAFINFTETEEDEEEEESEWKNDFNWLVLPSLITALALIIAIVGYYVRKFTFNRKPKIKTKYDRRKTLDKDIDRREQIALRKQIIAELNEELTAIDKEIEEYKVLATQKFEVIKERIVAEQERIRKEKLDIEIKKKEAKAEREKQLKETPELVSNTKAERDYANFIAKLDRQELALQKQLNVQNMKLSTAEQPDNIKLDAFLERKEYIRNEIAKIESEIDELAREEQEMWSEYKVAKEEAKKKKLEEKREKTARKSPTKKVEETKTPDTNKVDETKENIPSVENETVAEDNKEPIAKDTDSKESSDEK